MTTRTPPKRSSGALSEFRKPLEWPDEEPFKILSIDGGGIRGIFPACVLTELEDRFLNGTPIGSCFDLITGTSTGGIIAVALAKGLSAREIGELYLEKGSAIFPPAAGPRGWGRRIKQLFRAVYCSDTLSLELDSILGDECLRDCAVRLCIPAFEGRYGEPWIYKTPHHPDYTLDADTRLTTVAMATAAAPTYLKALQNQGYVMVDGGLFANNPIMIGVTDALSCYRLDRRQIQVLSIGCGSAPYRVEEPHFSGGKWQWRDAISAAIAASSANSFGQASLLIGRDNILRIDVTGEDASNIALDDYEAAKRLLPPHAASVIDELGNDVYARFLNRN